MLWPGGYFCVKIIPAYWSILASIHTGILNLPAVALGIITGGFVLKRFKLGVIGAARVSISASVGSFCLLAIQVFIRCENAEVAGLTVSYQGWVARESAFDIVTVWRSMNEWVSKFVTSVHVCTRAPQVSYNPQTLLSQCNMGCSCSMKHWDPVCAYNGMTYTSPCLAGCQTSTGTGKEMVRQQLTVRALICLRQ